MLELIRLKLPSHGDRLPFPTQRRWNPRCALRCLLNSGQVRSGKFGSMVSENPREQKIFESGTTPFPRGFLLTQGPHVPPVGFEPGPILDNFSVDPLTEVSYAIYSHHYVILLGLVFRKGCDGAGEVANTLAKALAKNEASFLSDLRSVTGRFAVIYGGPGFLSVLSDATATRTIFYDEDGGCIASHAQLVAAYRGTSEDRDPLPFMNGFPGNFTPYRGVKMLTANLVCDLWECGVRRYWPSKKLARLSSDDVADLVLDEVCETLIKTAQVAPVKLALTAGIDSRVVLACALKAGINFEAFTYGSPVGSTKVDHGIAKHLASEFGFSHTSVRSEQLDPKVEKCFLESCYTQSHMRAIGGLQRFFGSKKTIGLNGNLFEIARDHYAGVRKYESEYFGAKLASIIYYRKLSPKFKKKIASMMSVDKYIHTIEPYFAQWLADSGGFVGGYFPPMTQFYWEHRMAAWNGPFTLERDFYSNFLVPFNSHRLFELFLSVPESERFEGSIPRSILSRVDTKLVEIPVNPPSFPVTS